MADAVMDGAAIDGGETPLRVGGFTLTSRLVVGTGKYASYAEMARCLEASGTDCVTVIVRDKNTGKPRVDNPEHLDPIQIGQMSREEREELGLWLGDWAKTAQGRKRVQRQPDGSFKAVDPLIACNHIIVVGDAPNETKIMAVHPRCDVKQGGVIPAHHLTPVK